MKKVSVLALALVALALCAVSAQAGGVARGLSHGHRGQSVRVVRSFGHSTGYGYSYAPRVVFAAPYVPEVVEAPVVVEKEVLPTYTPQPVLRLVPSYSYGHGYQSRAVIVRDKFGRAVIVRRR